jgi:hypothetical protein
MSHRRPIPSKPPLVQTNIPNPTFPQWTLAFDAVDRYAPTVPFDTMLHSLADHFNAQDPYNSTVDVLLDFRFEPYIDPMGVAMFALVHRLPDVPESVIHNALRRSWNPRHLRQTIKRVYDELAE